MGFKRSQDKMQRLSQRLRDGMTRTRHHGRGAGRDPARGRRLRALRLPRVARRLLRADRLRLGLSQVPPPGGLPGGAAERLADGLLRAGDTREGRPAPRHRGAADRRGELELEVHARAGERAGRPARRAPRACATRTACASRRGSRSPRERARRPFADLADLVRRVSLRRGELEALAELGALAAIDPRARTRRSALWQVAGLERDSHSLVRRPRARTTARLRSPR